MASAATGSLRSFVRFAWATLAVTLLVIVWGGVVRATGSGAGCGSHWPLCNGTVVPLDPTVNTIIEFTHRLSSGAVMLMTVWLVVLARRTFVVGHAARRWAWIFFGFMMFEAAIGAGIVLLELVADNASALRAAYVGGHLVNTLLLVGAGVAVVWHADPPARDHGGAAAWPLTVCLLGMLVVASTGAVVALGDTLFPHASLAEGIRADFDPTSHFLIRLRIWHPVAAALLAATVIGLVWHGRVLQGAAQATPRRLIGIAVVVQTTLGLVNLLLLAPLALQMAHLLVSNLLWMPLVWAWLTARGVEGP